MPKFDRYIDLSAYQSNMRAKFILLGGGEKSTPADRPGVAVGIPGYDSKANKSSSPRSCVASEGGLHPV